MLHIEQSAESVVVRSAGLQLAFRFELDRWRHDLAVRTASGWQIVLASVEGTPEDALGSSPAFQELRLETIAPDVQEFQLFGRAGRGVYSAAVRFEGGRQLVSFDVAARAQREGTELCRQSTYEVPGSVIAEVADPEGRGGERERGRGNRGDEGGGLEALPSTPSAVLVCVESGETARLTGCLLCKLGPPHGAQRVVLATCGDRLLADSASAPRNLRWQYQIQRAGGP